LTRFFIAFHVGDRSGDSAEALIKTIKARIRDVPGLITADGFEAYVEKINPYHLIIPIQKGEQHIFITANTKLKLVKMNILFLPKLLPRADIIGGPILIYHRIKNLSSMGHKITLIAPAYTDEDRTDTSLEPFCEQIIKIDSVRERPEAEVEALYKRLNRPKVFLTGDGGYNERIEDALKSALKENRFDAVIAGYAMMGQ
jgi:hypothetical protein